MSKYTRKSNRVSEQTQEEAFELASAVLKPSEIKEHRKIVAQGIQKGIDLYKKKHKTKSRELDKKLKKLTNTTEDEVDVIIEPTAGKFGWLPWALLGFSWLGFVAMYMKGYM